MGDLPRHIEFIIVGLDGIRIDRHILAILGLNQMTFAGNSISA